MIDARHVELEQAVADGYFRPTSITGSRAAAPDAAAEREDDVELLARAHLDRFLAESRDVVKGLSRQALTVMTNYGLRENRLTPHNLGLGKRVSSGFLTMEEARMRAEHDTISRALWRNQNNVAAAARHLGVSRATLYRALERVSHVGATTSPILATHRFRRS